MTTMDSKPNPVYEDFEVHTEWVHEAVEDTLIAYLPGFSKEQLKVQITSTGKLRISGERATGVNKFSRFSKELDIPSNCDQNNIKANFKGGMLHIKHPKLIVPADDHEKQEQSNVPQMPHQTALPQPPTPRPAADVVPQKQSNVAEHHQAIQEAPPIPKATMEKQTGNVADHDNVSEKALDKEKETKLSDESKKGWDQEEKTSTGDEKLEKDAAASVGKENIIAKKLLDRTDKNQLGINMVWLKYMQAVDDLAMGLKNPRKMVNTVLGVLLVLVIGVYLRNTIRSFSHH